MVFVVYYHIVCLSYNCYTIDVFVMPSLTVTSDPHLHFDLCTLTFAEEAEQILRNEQDLVALPGGAPTMAFLDARRKK